MNDLTTIMWGLLLWLVILAIVGGAIWVSAVMARTHTSSRSTRADQLDQERAHRRFLTELETEARLHAHTRHAIHRLLTEAYHARTGQNRTPGQGAPPQQ